MPEIPPSGGAVPGKSLTVLPNTGEWEVSNPSTEVIGTWENGMDGFQNYVIYNGDGDGSYVSRVNSDYATDGQKGVRLEQPYDADTSIASKMDLTGIDTLRLDVVENSGSEARLWLWETLDFNDSLGISGRAYNGTIELDVSDVNRKVAVTITATSGADTEAVVVDNLRAPKSKRITYGDNIE